MVFKEYKKLHAEWYDLASGQQDYSKELDFWVKSIEASGEPALELGSGTGRILIPLLDRGLDVVGIDTSEDMTARCLSACKAKGLKPEIYMQSMVKFDLDRKFKLIFLDSGGLGLFTSDDDINSTFERVMAHLEPGGTFIYEYEPVSSAVKNTGDQKNNDWTGNYVRGPDGVVISWRIQKKYDADTRIWEWLFIVEKFVNGSLIETEANERWGRVFTLEEAEDYARSAGFADIKITDYLSDDPPKKDSEVITVSCKKP